MVLISSYSTDEALYGQAPLPMQVANSFPYISKIHPKFKLQQMPLVSLLKSVLQVLNFCQYFPIACKERKTPITN